MWDARQPGDAQLFVVFAEVNYVADGRILPTLGVTVWTSRRHR
ncbi:MAG: hypothetical protein R3F59_17490 [Myxococcota bacterium]